RHEDDHDDGEPVHHALNAGQDVPDFGVQRLGERHQHGGADHRPPKRADAAEQRHDQRLGGNQHAEHALRRDHEQHHGVKAADGGGHGGAHHHRAHLPGERVYAGGFGGGLVLLDRGERETETRALDVQRDDHAG